jgi:hypothetical protein
VADDVDRLVRELRELMGKRTAILNRALGQVEGVREVGQGDVRDEIALVRAQATAALDLAMASSHLLEEAVMLLVRLGDEPRQPLLDLSEPTRSV